MKNRIINLFYYLFDVKCKYRKQCKFYDKGDRTCMKDGGMYYGFGMPAGCYYEMEKKELKKLYKETNNKFVGRMEHMLYYICGCDIKRGKEVLEECLKKNNEKNKKAGIECQHKGIKEIM